VFGTGVAETVRKRIIPIRSVSTIVVRSDESGAPNAPSTSAICVALSTSTVPFM
jgi:hypothetical protein